MEENLGSGETDEGQKKVAYRGYGGPEHINPCVCFYFEQNGELLSEF